MAVQTDLDVSEMDFHPVEFMGSIFGCTKFVPLPTKLFPHVVPEDLYPTRNLKMLRLRVRLRSTITGDRTTC